MVFLLVLVMIISPCRSWSIESYEDLKVADSKEGFREDHLHSQRLMSLFVQFQKQYLNFKFKEAQSSLREIVELQLLKDWNEEERKIFSTSYLRLAQMDELYRHQWIDSFLAFNESLFIDEDIFPPSFIQWIRDRHKRYQMNTHIWYGQNVPESVKAVIINGEEFNRLGFSRKIDPNMKYRVTFMKSEYNQEEKSRSVLNEDPYLVLVLSGKDLINYSFDVLGVKSQVKGVSFKPLLKGTKPGVVSNKLEDVQTQVSPDRTLVLNNIPQDTKPLKKNFHFEEPISKEKLQRKTSSNFLKKHKWFFIVFSGITAGLIVSHSVSKSSSRQRNRRVSHREDIHY